LVSYFVVTRRIMHDKKGTLTFVNAPLFIEID
jgi:hypothetical protein